MNYSDDVLAKYKPGEIVTDRAFTSTSRNPNVATGNFDGNTLMTVTGRNGADVSPHSAVGASEAEILYDKGTRFMVTDKQLDPATGKWLINMHEV